MQNRAKPTELWIIRSNRLKQSGAALFGIVAGGVMIWLVKRINGTGFTLNLTMLFGLCLLLGGCYMLLLGGRQSTIVDPKRRIITILNVNYLRTQRHTIPMNDIVDVQIEELGDRETSISYHLQLTLNNGQRQALLVGFYDGRHDRQFVENQRQRLMQYLHGQIG